MLYRVSGILFALFGGSLIYGHLAGDDQPRISETGFFIRYNGLISGLALLVAGLYLVIKYSKKSA